MQKEIELIPNFGQPQNHTIKIQKDLPVYILHEGITYRWNPLAVHVNKKAVYIEMPVVPLSRIKI